VTLQLLNQLLKPIRIVKFKGEKNQLVLVEKETKHRKSYKNLAINFRCSWSNFTQ